MTTQNKLLVEGMDDIYVVCGLLEYYQVPQVFKIKSKDGVEKLLETLDVELEESGLACMGILVDADQDLIARWHSLRDKLLRFGYADVPQNPDLAGTVIVQENLPVVGIWVMPDNRLPGMLEDLSVFWFPVKIILSGSELAAPWMIFRQKKRNFHLNGVARRRFTPGWPGKKNPASQWARLSRRVTWIPMLPKPGRSLPGFAACSRSDNFPTIPPTQVREGLRFVQRGRSSCRTAAN